MFSQQLKRLAGPALTLGGLFWITTSIVIVIIGLQSIYIHLDPPNVLLTPSMLFFPQ